MSVWVAKWSIKESQWPSCNTSLSVVASTLLRCSCRPTTLGIQGSMSNFVARVAAVSNHCSNRRFCSLYLRGFAVDRHFIVVT